MPVAVMVTRMAGPAGHVKIYHNIPYARFLAMALSYNPNTPLPETSIIPEA